MFQLSSFWAFLAAWLRRQIMVGFVQQISLSQGKLKIQFARFQTNLNKHMVSAQLQKF